MKHALVLLLRQTGNTRLAGHDQGRDNRYGSHLEALKAAYDELDRRVQELKKEGLCASVYTQLPDIEEETNGIMTYDRRVLKL